MDAHQFDLLTRNLTSALNRRRLAGLLASLGLATRAVFVPDAATKKRKKKKKRCKGGTTKCGKACVDLQTDAAHCGGCNRPCEQDETCVAGDCEGTTNGHPCTTDDDCGGGSQGVDGIHCNEATGQCACNQEVWGICQRFGNGAGLCGPCCPGATAVCPGETICPEPPGNGSCACPPERPRACPNSRCGGDFSTDSRHCGTTCEDCTAGGTRPTSRCCDAQCWDTAGCGPNMGGSICRGPCGNSCDPCPAGELCCASSGTNPVGVCRAGSVCPNPPL